MKMARGVLVEAGRWQRGLAAGGETLEAELARLRASDAERRRLEGMLGKGVERGSEGAREGGRGQRADSRGQIREGPAGTAGPPRGTRHKAGAAVPPQSPSHKGVDMDAKVRTYVVAEVRKELPREVPLINKVAAGYPTEFTDLGYPARVADEYVRVPTSGDVDDPDVFAARVVGDSMEPEYREGDVIVFSPGKVVKSGDDCFVRLGEGGETTFKRVYFEGEGTEARRHGGTEGEEGERAEGRGQRADEEGDEEEGIEGLRDRGIEAKSEEGKANPPQPLPQGGASRRAADATRKGAPSGLEDSATSPAGSGGGAGSGGWIRLQPLNNAYPAKMVRREEVAGLYAAVTWIRKLGGGGR